MGPYPNSDGFVLDPTAAQAWVVSSAPDEPGDDYDLGIYSDYPPGSSGFSTYVNDSSFTGNATDFVVGQYGSALGPRYYPAVTRFAINGSGDNYGLDNSNDVGRTSASSTARWVAQTMPVGRLADVYEAYLTAGVTYRMLL